MACLLVLVLAQARGLRVESTIGSVSPSSKFEIHHKDSHIDKEERKIKDLYYLEHLKILSNIAVLMTRTSEGILQVETE